MQPDTHAVDGRYLIRSLYFDTPEDRALREKLEYKALFYAGAALFFNILNLLTVKFAVLPVLYFPSLDRVFGVLIEDSTFLAKCLAYSARLLLIGWFCGALVGMLTGIAIGFSKTFSY